MILELQLAGKVQIRKQVEDFVVTRSSVMNRCFHCMSFQEECIKSIVVSKSELRSLIQYGSETKCEQCFRTL